LCKLKLIYWLIKVVIIKQADLEFCRPPDYKDIDMAEFYIALRAQRASEIFASDPDLLARFNELNHTGRAGILVPGKPYLTSCGPNDAFIAGQMSAMPLAVQQRIAQTHSHYEDYTLPIAQTIDEHIKPVMERVELYGLPAVAATMALAAEQSSALQKALIKYQIALQDLHQANLDKRGISGARSRGAHNPVISAKEAVVRQTHTELLQRFQAQLQRYAALNKASKTKNTLANVKRSIDVANSGRNMHGSTPGSQRTANSLQVSTSQQVVALNNYARYSRILGNGTIIIDAGFRVNKVVGAHNSGADATRVAITEGAGFAASLVTGVGVGKVAVGIGIKLALGPVGWIVLIGAGLYAGYKLSKTMDSSFKDMSGWGYDVIRSRL
jgi:hypothetical protein